MSGTATDRLDLIALLHLVDGEIERLEGLLRVIESLPADAEPRAYRPRLEARRAELEQVRGAILARPEWR